MRQLLLTLLASLCLAFGLTPQLPAHPVPKDNHDRTLVVRLTPEAVVVEYRLEMDETTGARELPKSEIAGITTRKELHATITRCFADILADNLVATLDGKELVFRCVRSNYAVTDHIRCDYRFEAPWSPQPNGRHKFTFRESNYELDDFSSLRLRLTSDDRLTLVRVDAPSEAVMDRPGDDRKPGDGERLRTATATFTKSAPAPAAFEEPNQEAVPAEAETPLPAAKNVLLGLLLDSRYGVALLLGLAALFGAAHALTPGHGKTLVAAYLVGERGTVWHALLLGVVTTLTHTAAVLLLAALLPLFFPKAVPATVQTVLGLVGGLLIAGLGVWLLLRRLMGQADHIHIGGGHHHHGHDHDEVPSDAGEKVGLGALVMLGVSGGIVPCWDAIAMLGFAISAQRLWLGLPLLLAFSAGLAGVLIAIGIGVVLARNYAGARWNASPRFRGLIRALPLVSAILVTAMGLWLCYDSVQLAATGR